MRVSRAGYPNRFSHAAFLARYRFLAPGPREKAADGGGGSGGGGVEQACHALLRELGPRLKAAFLKLQEKGGGGVALAGASEWLVGEAAPQGTGRDLKEWLAGVGLQCGKTKVHPPPPFPFLQPALCAAHHCLFTCSPPSEPLAPPIGAAAVSMHVA